MRLDKLLETTLATSRGQMKSLIKTGQVLVDGEIASSGSQLVDPGLQEILVADQKIDQPQHRYFLLNKPAGAVTANSDAQHPTVFDSLAASDRHPDLYAVGRLDRDTQGLLLLTDNGPLGYRLLHPRHHVTKVYEVEVNGPLGPDAPAFFAHGVRFLDGTTCKPAKLTLHHTGPERSRASLEIAEGKFHQVKKMFLAYGVKVTSLTRTQFGPLELGDLPPGAYRSLTEQEKVSLKAYFD